MSNYIKDTYGVPADIGRKILFCGRPGTIVGLDTESARIKVKFVGETTIKLCHPAWNIIYDEAEVVETIQHEIDTLEKRIKELQEYLETQRYEYTVVWWDCNGKCITDGEQYDTKRKAFKRAKLCNQLWQNSILHYVMRVTPISHDNIKFSLYAVWNCTGYIDGIFETFALAEEHIAEEYMNFSQVPNAYILGLEEVFE